MFMRPKEVIFGASYNFTISLKRAIGLGGVEG